LCGLFDDAYFSLPTIHMQEQKNYLLPQHRPDLKFSCEKREVVGSNEKNYLFRN
jgi:hypothetical protein